MMIWRIVTKSGVIAAAGSRSQCRFRFSSLNRISSLPPRLYSTAADPSQVDNKDYTETAWEGIVGAVDAAQGNRQHIVESEHLMKSLLEQKDGLARRILTKAGLDNTSALQATGGR